VALRGELTKNPYFVIQASQYLGVQANSQLAEHYQSEL
jgi:hypothetical protein